jgi:hypothetical protein
MDIAQYIGATAKLALEGGNIVRIEIIRSKDIKRPYTATVSTICEPDTESETEDETIDNNSDSCVSTTGSDNEYNPDVSSDVESDVESDVKSDVSSNNKTNTLYKRKSDSTKKTIKRPKKTPKCGVRRRYERLTTNEVQYLKDKFRKNPRPDSEKITKYSEALKRPIGTIRSWFYRNHNDVYGY